MLISQILNAALESGIEWVGNVGNDPGERVGLAGAQTARGSIGNVPQVANGVLDALARLGRHGDRGAVVQHVRHGRLRDAGAPCDIGLGRLLFARALISHNDAYAELCHTSSMALLRQEYVSVIRISYTYYTMIRAVVKSC